MILTIFLGYNFYSIGYLMAATCFFGAFTFNYIPIVYEQAMQRLPASYLLSVTILFHVSGQLFTTLSTLLFGFLLEDKTKKGNIAVLLIFASAYVIIFLLNLKTPKLTKIDDKFCEEMERKKFVGSLASGK